MQDNILEVLKLQLSNFLKYLIDRKNRGRLDPLKEFLNETEKAQMLALEKPDYWEYLLMAELLKSRFQVIEKKFNELENGLIYVKSIRLDSFDYFRNISPLFGDLSNILEMMSKIINEEIKKSFGEIGVEGNAFEILEVADKLYSACLSAFEWEQEVKSYYPPDNFSYLSGLLKGCAKTMFDSMKDLPKRIEEPFLAENIKPGGVIIDFEFQIPANITKINQEIERISNNPDYFL